MPRSRSLHCRRVARLRSNETLVAACREDRARSFSASPVHRSSRGLARIPRPSLQWLWMFASGATDAVLRGNSLNLESDRCAATRVKSESYERHGIQTSEG